MAKLKSLIKSGFGIGIGVLAAQMIFVLLGMAFFIPGYIMYNKETKDNSTSGKIGGLVLMGVGVVLMGGIGLGLFMGELDDML